MEHFRGKEKNRRERSYLSLLQINYSVAVRKDTLRLLIMFSLEWDRVRDLLTRISHRNFGEHGIHIERLRGSGEA